MCPCMFTMPLQASVSGLGTSQLQLQLSTNAAFPEKCEYQVVLAKLRPGALTAADIPAGIAVSTMSFSPLSSLYHSLKDVYSPLLGMGAKDAADAVVDGRLSELLQQVQAGLGAAVRKGPVGVGYSASNTCFQVTLSVPAPSVHGLPLLAVPAPKWSCAMYLVFHLP